MNYVLHTWLFIKFEVDVYYICGCYYIWCSVITSIYYNYGYYYLLITFGAVTRFVKRSSKSAHFLVQRGKRYPIYWEITRPECARLWKDLHYWNYYMFFCLYKIFSISFKPQFGLLFDIDGVIARGSTPLPAAIEGLQKLTDGAGNFVVPVAFVTNGCNTSSQKRKPSLNGWVLR